MTDHAVVSREESAAKRKELLWVPADKDYEFTAYRKDEYPS